jgi:hypothetical protein
LAVGDKSHSDFEKYFVQKAVAVRIKGSQRNIIGNNSRNMKAQTKNYLFWLGSFALMIGMVAGLSATMSVYSSRQIVQSESLGIKRYTINAAHTHLQDIALTPPLGAIQMEKVRGFFNEVLADEEVLKARIWLRNGYISLGWDDSILFTEFEPARKITKAFSLETDPGYKVSSEIRSASADPCAFSGEEATRIEKEDTGPNKKQLVVYIPMFSSFSERVNYIIEIIKPAATVLYPMHRVQMMIWLITGLGLGLYPALLILANALYRRRKEHEIETIKAKQLEAINSMVVTLNHELNQPLTGICAYADLLKKASKNDEDLIRFADKINEQAIRLSSLIKRISDITRVEMTEYIDGTKMLDLSKSSEKEQIHLAEDKGN